MKRARIDILDGTDDEFEKREETIRAQARSLVQGWRKKQLQYEHLGNPKAERAGRMADIYEDELQKALSPGIYQTRLIDEIAQAPPPAWLIEGVLPEAVLSILVGYTGVGKSLLAMSMAAAIASGRPLFGRFKVNRRGPVLMIDEENSPQHLGERARALRIPGAPIHYLLFDGILLDDSRSFETLIRTIEKIQPVQIFIDALIRVHRGKENDATEMARVMGKLREITNRGIGVCPLHHHGKTKNNLEVRARGSSDIIGAVDLEYSLAKNSDHLELRTVKSRGAQIEPLSLKIETHSEGPVLSYLGVAETGVSKSKQREQIILSMEDPHTITEILELLEEIPISERKLRPVLNRLVETGKLRKTTGDHNTKLYEPVFSDSS